jgi:hypothetical protein
MTSLPPIDITGADVLQLPVKRREPVTDRMLVPVEVVTCRHIGGPFEVDVDGAKCKCLKCGAEVGPFFVLEELMHKESRWMRTREAYLDEMQRLGERSRTKCQHCKQITRISRA